MKLPFNIPFDKFLHFGVGALVGSVLCPFFGQLVAAHLVALLGFAKERYDLHNLSFHTVDVWDAYWTYAGGLYAAAVSFGYPYLTHLLIVALRAQ